MAKTYRQGDVLLIKVPKSRIKDATRSVPRDKGRVILAYGEVTGHAHAIDDKNAEQLTNDALTTRFLQVLGEAGVDLVHEEHDTITVPPGVYEVRGQREASVENPQVTQRVRD